MTPARTVRPPGAACNGRSPARTARGPPAKVRSRGRKCGFPRPRENRVKASSCCRDSRKPRPAVHVGASALYGRTPFDLQSLREGWANRRSALARSARPPILPAQKSDRRLRPRFPGRPIDIGSSSPRCASSGSNGVRPARRRARGLPGVADLRARTQVPSKPRRVRRIARAIPPRAVTPIGIARLSEAAQSGGRDAVSRVPRDSRQRVFALSRVAEATPGNSRGRQCAPARCIAERHSILQTLREGWANRRSALAPAARPPMLPGSL